MINLKGCHFPKDVVLMCVRWYVAYSLSYRHVEELMEERGVSVDHATVNRWVVKHAPELCCMNMNSNIYQDEVMQF